MNRREEKPSINVSLRATVCLELVLKGYSQPILNITLKQVKLRLQRPPAR